MRILSIDGGGIRGLIVLIVLRDLEAMTSQRICELFDVFCGVSVGAMIAAMLKIGKWSCAELIEIFKRNGKTLFSKPSPLSIAGSGLFVPKYSAVNYGNELKKIIDADLMMSDLPCFITYAYDTVSRSPVIFSGDKWNNNNIAGLSSACRESAQFPAQCPVTESVCGEFGINMPKNDRNKNRDDISVIDTNVWKACVASASAPLFFPPYREIAGRNLIDGGMAANNPAAIVYSYSVKNYSRNVDYLVSIGTGDTAQSISPNVMRGIRQIENIIDICLEASNDFNDYVVQQILGDKYFRLQTQIADIKLDDVRSFKLLEDAARLIIESAEYHRLLKVLIQ